MIAELLGGEVLLSELLNEGNFVKQADVFTSASTSLDVKGSAFSNSSTAPTAGSLAQLNSGSLYLSLLSASTGSSSSIVAASTNAGAVASFGFSDIVLAGGSDSNVALLSSSSAVLSVDSGAFFNSSTTPTSWSLAQLNGGSRHQSLLSASAGSSPSIVAANVNAGFVESFGSGDIAFAGGSNSNTTLLSSAGAARPMFTELLGGEVLSFELLSGDSPVSVSFVSGAYKHSPFLAQSPSVASFAASSDSNVMLLSAASAAISVVAGAYGQSPFFAQSPSLAKFSAGSDNNVALLSSANAVLSVVSGAFKHSPFFAQSPSSAEFGAGSYFLSDTTAYAFSYTNLPANEVKLCMLYADAKSSASYSGIGVLQYAPPADLCRPLEVRYMHRPQKKERAACCAAK